MKNLFLLPTEKPSRLSFVGDRSSDVKDKLVIFNTEGEGSTTHHIYITSDEEIKEGDWCLDLDTSKVFKLGNWHTNRAKKIILTTDPDLISDGVQSIDDEFLEWFVKNPSCEKVEVKKGFEDGTAWGYNFLDYKIIIPQEESNPFELPKALPDDIFYQSLGTKQETPEIDKTNWKAVYEDSLNMQKASNAGYESKIQELKQEIKRSYSGEEVIQLYKDYESYVIKTPINEVIGFSEWFIQNHYRFFSYETN